MPNLGLFVEDVFHERFISQLLRRMAEEYNQTVTLEPRSVRGGHGRVLHELKEYLRDLRRYREQPYDAIIVTVDANCKTAPIKQREINEALGEMRTEVIIATPDPHIERWMLLDSAAFKKAVGRGCATPPEKCERGFYKDFLRQEIARANVPALLGGLEYVEDFIAALDLSRMSRVDRSFGDFLSEVHSFLKRHRRK